MGILLKIYNYWKYGSKKKGLVDLTDDKNFGSRALYKPTKEDLQEAMKETFIVFNPKKLDQLDNDNCVGYGGAYEADATEDFEGKSGQGSGAFVFANAKRWSGQSIHSFGTSLLAGCMARVKYGICDKELYEYKKGWRNWFANYHNISEEAYKNGAKHKASSAWQINVPWGITKFEAIVPTLFHFRAKKVLIGTGNNAHRITVIGYDKPRDCLICVDTYGERTYNKGMRYVSRTEARTLFTSYFVIDIERSLAEILVKYNDKAIKLKNKPECYLVRNGEKHRIPNEPTAWSFNTLLFSPNFVYEVEKEEYDKIPSGESVNFKKGKNWEIVKRFFELTPEQFKKYKEVVDKL